MGQLSDYVQGLESLGNPLPPPEAPAPLDISCDFTQVAEALDRSELIEALGKLQAQIGKIPATDTKAFAKELVLGLSRVCERLSGAEVSIDLTPVVEAIKAIPQPETPIVNVSRESGPVTFAIHRDRDGRMTQVVATPGKPRRARQKVGTIE